MQLVSVVSVAGNVPSEKWDKLVGEIHDFCKKRNINLVKMRSDDKGNDRYLELVFEKDDAKKVKRYVAKRLLKKI